VRDVGMPHVCRKIKRAFPDCSLLNRRYYLVFYIV
jgi:hypothetical protein